MDKNQILIFAVIIVVVGIRLYMKYAAKKGKKGIETKPSHGSFPGSSKEDEYEPYSKK